MTEFDVGPADWRDEHEQLTRIRFEVFVEEQQVPPELELDGIDPSCQHIKAQTPNGLIIGCARLLPDYHVGRMCVVKPWRARGVGSAIMTYIIELARQRELPKLQLNAQVEAAEFYQRFGFNREGAIFMDAGIEHVKMTLIIDH